MPDNGGMYIITNREIRPEKRGFDKFGKEPNASSPWQKGLFVSRGSSVRVGV